MQGFSDKETERYAGSSWEHILPGAGCSWPCTLAAAAVGLAGVLALNFAAVVMVLGVARLFDYPMDMTDLQPLDVGSGAAAFLLMGVLIPIAEEILFRGIWFGALRTKHGFAESAILPSLAFGLIHGAVAFFAVFLAAMFLCWLYERTHRLAAPILVHVANNLLVLAAPVSVEALSGRGAVPAAGLAILVTMAAVFTIRRITEEFYCQNDRSER